SVVYHRSLHDALPIFLADVLELRQDELRVTLSVEDVGGVHLCPDGAALAVAHAQDLPEAVDVTDAQALQVGEQRGTVLGVNQARSEEHTSELQSRENL